jgi:hypothetical protein
MTTALVVSGVFSRDSQRVSGIYQRLGTQVQALGKVVDRVDCLFLMPVEQHYAPDAIRDHEDRLRRLWSPAVSIRLARTVTEDVPRTLWGRLDGQRPDLRTGALPEMTRPPYQVPALERRRNA